jgi:hypothetical protein
MKYLDEYRDAIRQVTRQGLIDIMLCSASNVEQLAINEGYGRYRSASCFRLPNSKATKPSKLYAPSSAASPWAGLQPMARSPRWPACRGGRDRSLRLVLAGCNHGQAFFHF